MTDLIELYNEFMLDYAESKELVLNKTEKELAFELAQYYQATYPKIPNLHNFLINSLNTYKSIKEKN